MNRPAWIMPMPAKTASHISLRIADSDVAFHPYLNRPASHFESETQDPAGVARRIICRDMVIDILDCCRRARSQGWHGADPYPISWALTLRSHCLRYFEAPGCASRSHAATTRP